MRFLVTFINHFYTASRRFDTVSDAETYGVAKGFDFVVFDTERREVVVGWSAIGGFRRY